MNLDEFAIIAWDEFPAPYEWLGPLVRSLRYRDDLVTLLVGFGEVEVAYLGADRKPQFEYPRHRSKDRGYGVWVDLSKEILFPLDIPLEVKANTKTGYSKHFNRELYRFWITT